MTVQEVYGLKCDVLRDKVAELIEALDALDENDYFGTEGWRHMLMGED